MRRITLYILVALMGMSCGRANYAKLAKVDSLLVADSADSATKILRSIDPDDLTNQNEAYYALLYTQVQYKCYEPIESDSIINIAVRYYTDNFDRDKLTRSLMYRGAVYADLNFRQLALDSYNEAEQIADTTDLMTMGLLNFRLGELYQNSYIDNNEPVVRYKRAAAFFRAAGNESFENYSYSYIGQMYIEEDYDSAYYYINKTIDWASKHEDEKIILTDSRVNLSKLYWYYKKFPHERKDLLLSIYRDTVPFESDVYHHLANVYCELGLIDSAKFYATQYPVSRLPEDTMSYHMMLESLAVAQEDYKTAYQNKIIASAAASKIISQGKAEEYYTIDRQYDNSVANAKVDQLKTERVLHIYLLVIVSLAFGVFVFIGIVLWNRKKRAIDKQRLLIEQLQSGALSSQVTFNNLHYDWQVKLRDAMVKRLALIGELITLSYEYHGNEKLFTKKFDELIARDPLSSDAYVDILDVVNLGYHQLIDHLKAQYPKINQTELLICALTCIGYTSQQLFVILGAKSIETIYNQKYKIGVKLEMKGDLKSSLDKIVDTLHKEQ